ncbi:hypothetical protein, partial [Salmonella sp. s54395]|uniref:hypothetical protein n=1 Tax=Salmonella sp. s54395 TaxID=3159664 RepID=UPI003980FA23
TGNKVTEGRVRGNLISLNKLPDRSAPRKNPSFIGLSGARMIIMIISSSFIRFYDLKLDRIVIPAVKHHV